MAHAAGKVPSFLVAELDDLREISDGFFVFT
jgi:hypothetical protein